MRVPEPASFPMSRRCVLHSSAVGTPMSNTSRRQGPTGGMPWPGPTTGEVPEKRYRVPIGRGVVRRQGPDITIAGTSWMVVQALKAADELSREGVEAEVIDLQARSSRSTSIACLNRSGRQADFCPWMVVGGAMARLRSCVHLSLRRLSPALGLPPPEWRCRTCRHQQAARWRRRTTRTFSPWCRRQLL